MSCPWAGILLLALQVISDVREEDSGVYYCALNLYIIGSFRNRTRLIVSDSGLESSSLGPRGGISWADGLSSPGGGRHGKPDNGPQGEVGHGDTLHLHRQRGRNREKYQHCRGQRPGHHIKGCSSCSPPSALTQQGERQCQAVMCAHARARRLREQDQADRLRPQGELGHDDTLHLHCQRGGNWEKHQHCRDQRPRHHIKGALLDCALGGAALRLPPPADPGSDPALHQVPPHSRNSGSTGERRAPKAEPGGQLSSNVVESLQ
ncbi:hypothetical protein Y1Q_0004430 [Alligator mississippiensis]|uniref:Immunoglobulin V-set domain-containing protein n=1 Tax=Alligator mississippiensis TaxID=8496 RepID=A0A151NSS5_ALLMI|nr:hypothetical protein Y1Q_0004430 [Alligator mississippiensis]